MNMATPNFARGSGATLFVAGAGVCQLGRSSAGDASPEDCFFAPSSLDSRGPGKQIQRSTYGTKPTPTDIRPRNRTRQHQDGIGVWRPSPPQTPPIQASSLTLESCRSQSVAGPRLGGEAGFSLPTGKQIAIMTYAMSPIP